MSNRRKLYEAVFKDYEETAKEITELVDLLERVYPLVVSGTMNTASSTDAAHTVQELLARYNRMVRPPHSYGRAELEDIAA
jgi:Zn/Cd-binding protein ZinT